MAAVMAPAPPVSVTMQPKRSTHRPIILINNKAVMRVSADILGGAVAEGVIDPAHRRAGVIARSGRAAGQPVEVRGLPLIHDKTVDEWGTAVLGYFMTGPPAGCCTTSAHCGFGGSITWPESWRSVSAGTPDKSDGDTVFEVFPKEHLCNPRSKTLPCLSILRLTNCTSCRLSCRSNNS